MDAAAPPLDLAHAPFDVITSVLQSMSLADRFTCALVCKAWAEAATAATRSIILGDRRLKDLSCLQAWLDKHGDQLEVLQLHQCFGATLTALPCPQLQDLLLHSWNTFNIDSRVWGDLATAPRLTSVSLHMVQTDSQQADVVSALTALPDLKQLTWHAVQCSGEQQLSDSLLLQQLTKLTGLQLECFTAAAVEHLSALTKLQRLSIGAAEGWAAAGCPGLQELKALTRLQLDKVSGIPASVTQLTALQQLRVPTATPTSLNKLQALTGLTQLEMHDFSLSAESPPLQLPGLQHLDLTAFHTEMPMSFLASCTQLRVLKLWGYTLVGPGSLVASTVLQQLVLTDCMVNAADGTACPVTWQEVLSGPGQLPHLTSLELQLVEPALQDCQWPDADIECLVTGCSSLQVLQLGTLPVSAASGLTRLPGLTSLSITIGDDDEQCRSLVQLTGLRELNLRGSEQVYVAGLRELAALEQLTSLEFDRVVPEDMQKLHGLVWAVTIVNQAPAGHSPDVSAQLLRACDVLEEAAGDI